MMEALITSNAYKDYNTLYNAAYAELEKKIAPIWVAYGNMRAGVCKEMSAKEWAAHMVTYAAAHVEFDKAMNIAYAFSRVAIESSFRSVLK